MLKSYYIYAITFCLENLIHTEHLAYVWYIRALKWKLNGCKNYWRNVSSFNNKYPPVICIKVTLLMKILISTHQQIPNKNIAADSDKQAQAPRVQKCLFQ